METYSQTESHKEAQPAAGPAGTPPAHAAPGELDLFSFVLLLRRHLWRIIGMAILGFLIAAAYTLVVKPRYVAATSVVIPHSSASANTILQQIGGLDLLGGGFEIYIDIMKSRTVQEDMIRDLKLLDRWHLQDPRAAEGRLAARSKFGAAPEGLLTISYEDEDPKLAAAVANQYLVELKELNNKLTLTSATQQRKFFEQQMYAEKSALEDAEDALERSQEKKKPAPSNQTRRSRPTSGPPRACGHNSAPGRLSSLLPCRAKQIRIPKSSACARKLPG